ncbi:unnamed protein product [Parnassius apollo]|uniref:(apollo) hypothetical protein n=1 Tax=Parnassius apollo TaxID=110799 RepID=A0A8S3Y3M9_PARAO|nr:unnamed protein product [Parnassius apollo]
MAKNYVNKFRGESFFTPNGKLHIKDEPVSPSEEEFVDYNNFDFACVNGYGNMKKSLSMNDIAALKDFAKLDLQNVQEPRYRRPTSSNHDLSKTKFVSLAESIYHFQRDTPGRFHSTRPQIFRSQSNTGPSGLTVPQSPMLRCKKRSRPVHVLSLKEKEDIEIAQMKNFKIKAHPVPKSVIEGTKNLPEVPRKPTTIPEPFKLTEIHKKTIQSPKTVHNFKARPAPKHILEKPQIPTTTKAFSPNIHYRRGRSADQIKCDKKNNVVMKEIQKMPKPYEIVQRHGPVRPEPFSFEKRDEEMRKRREERIKRQLEEERKLASQFKAQPLPAAVKKQMHNASGKSTSSNASSENKENHFKFEARPPLVLYKAPFKPVHPPSQIVKPAPFDLTTEKRAAEREKFDRLLKEKEEENERLRQQKEREQKEVEERAQAAIRAKLIHHAKPIPVVEPFIPQKSSEPLTVPETPKFTHEKTKEELQEEEELQLALALSQSEAEQKEKERRSRTLVAPDTSLHPTVSPSASSVSASPEHSTAASSELSRYLDRSYWEQRLSRDSAPAPTAPASAPASNPVHDATEPEFPKVTTNKAQEDDAEDKEIDEFIESLKSQVEIFVNRMKSNSSRGRSIANDTSVQTLFMNITAMHSRLLRYIQQQDDKRVYLESLQDKVSQVRDSRAALDTLRAEHAARLAAAAEAAERQRQMQMAAKLQAMRKKKHEYLQYQRQLALQRVQEQEREMQMRQEQQKHQYMMSANNYYMPGVAMHHFQPGYPNQPMYASAQFHPQMMPQATTDGSVPLPGQPQMSQANMPMGVTQMGAVSQSMPQMATTYPMSTTGMTLSQAPPGVPTAMNQPNRPGLGQQMPLQQQMMMQHMHQLRMPIQPGVHQMMTQNVANGPNLQNTQPSQQIPKHNVPNQPQQPNTIMPPMSSGQQNIGQTLNPANSMIGMQMQNIRMPLMQGNPPGALQVSGYPLSMQNQQAGTQIPNISQPSQIPMTGQSMTLPGQQMIQGQTLPGHNQSNPINNHIPNQNQNVHSQGPQVSQGATQVPQSQQSQFSQGHHISIQGQPGQQMMMQGHQMIPQGQNIPQQNQQMPQNQMPQGPQMMQGQQINQQMMQGQQLPGPGQQIHPQGQHMPPQGQAPQQHQQMLPSGQQMPQPAQQVPPSGQQMPPSGQQMPPTGQQMPPSGQQVPPAAQQMPTQGQQMPQGQQVTQNLGQPLKMQQQNYVNGQQGQQTNQNQPSQTPTKSEHNNNTAELISFD